MSRKKKVSLQSTETAVESSAPSTVIAAPTRASFTAPKRELAAVMRRMNAIAVRKSTIRMLSHVAIKTGPEGVTMVATDLNLYATQTMPAWHPHGSGSVCVNAKALNDLLRKLPDGDVTVRALELGVEIVQGTASVILQSLPARDFPKVPEIPALSTIAAKPLRTVIETVEHAICQDQTRFHLAGVLLSYNAGKFRGVATDGHRLSLVDCVEREWTPTACGDEFTLPSKGVIVPEQACTEIRKLLKDGECRIAHKGAMLFVQQNGVTLACKLIDAQFPPYEQVIPKSNARLVTLDRAKLLGALGRAATNCSDARGVVLAAAGGTVKIETANPDKGNTCETLECETRPEGVMFEIGFNPKYLIDAIKAIGGDRVTLAISDNMTPLKYTDKHNGKPALTYQLEPILVRDTEHAATYPIASSPALFVVMPMRI